MRHVVDGRYTGLLVPWQESAISGRAGCYNAGMTAPPKRRWYQFRLRTLLVGVVLLSIPCAYVGHEWRIVAARKAWIARYRPYFSTITTRPAGGPWQSQPEEAPSAIRRLLGDEHYYAIEVPAIDEDIVSDEVLSEAKALFPEAFVFPEPPKIY